MESYKHQHNALLYMHLACGVVVGMTATRLHKAENEAMISMLSLCNIALADEQSCYESVQHFIHLVMAWICIVHC